MGGGEELDTREFRVALPATGSLYVYFYGVLVRIYTGYPPRRRGDTCAKTAPWRHFGLLNGRPLYTRTAHITNGIMYPTPQYTGVYIYMYMCDKNENTHYRREHRRNEWKKKKKKKNTISNIILSEIFRRNGHNARSSGDLCMRIIKYKYTDVRKNGVIE